MTEIDIKITLIQFLMKSNPNAIIVSEMPFYFGERRADIVMLEGEIASVFEIKSASDTTVRLPDQIKSYLEFFDYCYVVGEKLNLNSIRKASPPKVGLLTVDSSLVKVIRQSQSFKRQNKLALASVLPTATLQQLANSTSIKSQFKLAGYVAKKLTLKKLKNISRNFLYKQYESNFYLMKSETTEIRTADDLQTISRRSSVKLF